MAVLFVFAYHLDFSQAFQETFPGVHHLLKAGLGAPMFFVISGYCITASARKSIKSDESVWEFLFRRYRRIFPTYWFAILVIVCIPFVIEGLSSLKTGQYATPSAGHLNYGFLEYGYWDWVRVATLTQVFAVVPDGTDLQYKFTTVNACFWTLALEVQFYVATGFAVAIRRRFYPVMLAITALSVPCYFSSDMAVSGLFLPYWPMFGLGCLVYWLFENGYGLSRLLKHRAALASGLLTGGSLFGFMLYLDSDLPINRLCFAAFVAWILIVAQGLDANLERLSKSPYRVVRWPWEMVTTVGLISYSVYLLHARLRFVSMQILRQILPVDCILLDFGVVVLTLGMCYGFYRVFERPFAISKPSRGMSWVLPKIRSTRQKSRAVFS